MEISITTNIDAICKLLEDKKELDIETLSSKTKIKPGLLLKICELLENAGIVDVKKGIGKASVELRKTVKETPIPRFEGRVIDKYDIELHNVPGYVRILDIKEDPRPVYELRSVSLGPYTLEFLEYLQEVVARRVVLEPSEIIDQRKAMLLEDRFYNTCMRISEESFPGLSEEGTRIIAGILLHNVYGLGRIELLMHDDALEEVVVNGSYEPIVVYHKKYGWLKTNIVFKSEDEIYNIATQIGRKSGKEINVMNPIMDAHLPNGNRVNASLFPISAYGDTITIRRFMREPWTIVDFISGNLNTLSTDMAAFLWQAIQYEMNMLVVGGTASGKTSTLNTLCALIPPSNRIITIEDTREINLPQYLKCNWVPLITRAPSAEGKGGVDMLSLMVASLRMRPDRVIVGEVRRREEAEVLFEAMHTGHAVYSTIHADTGEQVMRRLTNPPFEIPNTELESLHLIVVMYRDRRTGKRRVYEIDEVNLGVGGEITLNRVYRWRARTDEFEKIGESTRVFGELSLHAGMSIDEIIEDIENKSKVLEWMKKNNVRSVDKIGSIMAVFYKNPDTVINAAEKGLKPENIL
ncbi:MAG: type II/IV secretion system ATPase subunit [Candidatus Micrarchaeia archaeon]